MGTLRACTCALLQYMTVAALSNHWLSYALTISHKPSPGMMKRINICRSGTALESTLLATQPHWSIVRLDRSLAHVMLTNVQIAQYWFPRMTQQLLPLQQQEGNTKGFATTCGPRPVANTWTWHLTCLQISKDLLILARTSVVQSK